MALNFQAEEFEFLDFGASSGGSISWAGGALGGRGFGVDIDPQKIKNLKSRGFDGMVADATDLDIPDNSVPYVTMINFLEHLPSPDLGVKMFESAIRVARDFVFMLGPDFEGGHYLHSLGFKKYFADWSGHTWHHRTHELKDILKRYPQYPSRLYQSSRIFDSYDRAIHPLAAARNGGPYDAREHPEKEFVQFDRKVFQTIMIVVQKNPDISMDQIMTRSLGMHMEYGSETNPPVYVGET